MNDQTIENEIQAKGKTAARITPADIENAIAEEHYFTPAQATSRLVVAGRASLPAGIKQQPHQSLSLLTFCVLVLRNGFTVTGESACASPENFDAEIGRKIARANAVQKIWPLMGYELRTELARPRLTEADAAADLAGKPRPDHPSA
ncbi:Gp49 family protein [Methylibium sp.]|uniref:Gp49 family protein n=1 Tax=Methylibium sp. TaxID=2067992 RepID=UPI003D0D7C36